MPNNLEQLTVDKKSRKSQKQKEALRLKERSNELAAEYEKRQTKIASGLVSNNPFDENFICSTDESKEEYINRNLERESREKLKVPKGIYQEKDWVESQYKWKFVEAIKSTSPHIIEDLRSIASNFKALFGKVSSKPDQNGEYSEMNDCLKKIEQLEELIFKTVISQQFVMLMPSHLYPEYRDWWKKIKLPVLLTKSFFDCEKSGDKLDISHSELNYWLSKEAKNQYGLESLAALIKAIQKKIVEYFQAGEIEQNSVLENYLTIKSFLYSWAEKYHLEKQWLYEFAYRVLCQFTEDENLSVEEVKLFLYKVFKKLQADEFKFERRGWWAGGESAKDYEKYLVAEFKKQLRVYFHEEYNSLKLDNQIQVTKPKDPTYKSVYCLIAWNEGATNPQIAKTFSAFNKIGLNGDDIKDALSRLKQYDLPKRPDRPGRKYLSPISDERVRQIREALIKNIENEVVANLGKNKALVKELNEVIEKTKGGKS